MSRAIAILTAMAAAFSLCMPVGGARAATGPWFWPVVAPAGRLTPVVLRGFAPPTRRWDAGHRGVDLAAPVGSPVRAAGDGVITFAGPLFGRGVVAVSHGASRTTYLPVAPLVKVGQRVAGGQVIGTVAPASPVSCDGAPSCLHWGFVTGSGHAESYRDPLALVGEDQVRLLPLWQGDAAAADTPASAAQEGAAEARAVTRFLVASRASPSDPSPAVSRTAPARPGAAKPVSAGSRAFDAGSSAGRVLVAAARPPATEAGVGASRYGAR